MKKKNKKITEAVMMVKCEDCKRATIITNNLNYNGEPFLVRCSKTGWPMVKDKQRICKDYE